MNGAESEAEAANRVLRQAAEARPENRESQLSLSDLYARLGSIKAALGDRDEALASYRNGVSVLEALNRRLPSDTLARRELMFAYSHVGDTIGSSNSSNDNRGDLPLAFEAYAKMAEQAKFLYDADQADARSLGDYGIALLRLGRATPPAGPRKRETLEHSRELLTRAAERDPRNRTIAVHKIWVETELGDYAAAIATGEKTMISALDDSSVLRTMESAVRHLAEEQARWAARASTGHAGPLAALGLRKWTLARRRHTRFLSTSLAPGTGARWMNGARWNTKGIPSAVSSGNESHPTGVEAERTGSGGEGPMKAAPFRA